ncbi:MAG: response regulator [Candidatus Scalindua sp.]
MKERKVLIIEDDPDHADLILDIFKMENVKDEVLLMKDGEEVIDFFNNMDSSAQDSQSSTDDVNGRPSLIDLMILDLNLPKVNGMDVLKFLKKNPGYCSIPVVILSTSSDQDTILEAYRNGANGYVTKPMSYEEFIQKIESLRDYWFGTNVLPVKN